MRNEGSFWPLTRRELFKLLPPGIASWLLAQVAPAASFPSLEERFIPHSAEGKKWLGNWIWEHVDSGLPFPPSLEPFFQRPPSRNLFGLFRKTFDAPPTLIRAIAQVSADSRYKLYVNGQYVGRGPARCDPVWQYYDEYDLKGFLRPGGNVIAALVHYYGEKTGWYLPGRPGFLFECALEHSGGSSVVKSDTTWKFLKAPMWAQDVPRINGSLGFVEVYDARQDVGGWNLSDFDDSNWQNVEIISEVSQAQLPLISPFPWENPVPRDIPALLEEEIRPSKVVMVGEIQNILPESNQTLAMQMSKETPGPLKTCSIENVDGLTSQGTGEAVIRTTPLGTPDSPGHSAVIVIDFGREVTGYPYLELDGVAGGIVDMGVSESLTDGRVTPMRNGLHCNRYITKDGRQQWQAFEWDGFRYLQLTIRNCPWRIALHQVGLNFTSYPVKKRGAFESSDPLLNQIWQTCRHTVQLCMHDAYEDCPNREQRQWVGDAYVETKVNYAVFGDTKLARKYLHQIAESQRSDGIVMMFYPGDNEFDLLHAFNIKDFVLHWVSTIWEYYRYTGDTTIIQELFPTLAGALQFFEKRVDSQGLLSNIPLWMFGDWAPIDRRDRNTLLNALFSNVLLESAEMSKLIGESGYERRYRKLAMNVKAAVRANMWDEGRGVYVDANINGVLSRRVSQQSNALCLLYDIATPPQQRRILSYIFDPERVKSAEMNKNFQAGFDEEKDVVQAQPFFMHWVNAALAHVGEYDRMVGFIRRLWGAMLAAGATTIWETWSPNASQCHGWSATPAFDLMTYILGVRGVGAGFDHFVIEPHPVGLEWVRGTFPSVKGDIHVVWRSSKDKFQMEASVPDAATASVLIPRKQGNNPETVWLNGQLVWEKEKARRGVMAKAEAGGVRITFGPSGRYKVESKY
jgi:alpha-L-rhamnosidase